MLAVYDVSAVCGVDTLIGQEGGAARGLNFSFPDFKAAVLDPGQKLTLPCERGVVATPSFNPAEAKINIVVTYRPNALTPWHSHTSFAMEAEKAEDGTGVWKNLAR